MLIELEKYSKLEAHLYEPVKLTFTRHQDNRNKMINYTAGGLLIGILLVSLSICYTNVDPAEFNMNLYMDDTNSETMKAYISFLAKYEKTYSDI
jgi:hypothetical protein